MTENEMLTQIAATAVFPLQLTLSDEPVQPNRRPIVAVLFRAGTPSIAPPHGADKRVVIDRSALEKLELERLIGLPFHATEDLSSHWEEEDGIKVTIPVGAIVEAERKDGIVYGRGFLWDLDHPHIVSKILAASEAKKLAISWEMVNVTMKDEGEFYRIYSFVPTGFALLLADYAAYKSLMPALAAIADKDNYDPKVQPLAVLLDDHRLLHAYYATLRRGGSVSDWTLTEIVKMHAAIVDEMILRHVQHRRGDGLSRTLNEESLPLQRFQFFTDEVERQVQDVWKVEKSQFRKWREKADKHEKIVLEESPPPSVPIGVPIAIQVEDFIVGIGAVAKFDGEWMLALPLIYSKPVSAVKVSKSLSAWRERLKIASETIDRLPDVLVVPGYIAITGSSLLTPHAKDIDMLICDNGVFQRLSSYFDVQQLHWTLTDKPAGLAIPIYDVILVKRVRQPIEPVADEFTERLVPHTTVEVSDVKGFVAARMRSLGDLDVYPQTVFVTTSLPTRRGLLKVTQENAEIHCDEGEIIPCPHLVASKPSSCLSATAEVWLSDSGLWSIADCLWWNATKVADLPFPWRLSFVRKLAEAFMMPIVDWRLVTSVKELASVATFILQDAQAVYGAERLVVKVNSQERRS